MPGIWLRRIFRYWMLFGGDLMALGCYVYVYRYVCEVINFITESKRNDQYLPQKILPFYKFEGFYQFCRVSKFNIIIG